MKGLVPGVIHKTEAGLVRMGIESEQGVKNNFESLKAVVKNEGKILVQHQVKPAAELIAGLVQDPQFGPCVMIGLGGVMAEIFKDVVFALAPLTLQDALDLMDRLKSRRIFEGFRGAEPADREAIARILVHLGQLGATFPQIKEIDINPLILARGKPIAVDASVILGG
jgi:acetyltransferase